jgi:hypothetical protein
MVKRAEKITLGEMRSSGAYGLVVFCSDYKCAHSVTISAEDWPDDVRLSDLEPQFVARSAVTTTAPTSGRTSRPGS